MQHSLARGWQQLELGTMGASQPVLGEELVSQRRGSF
jgi:hypothetical protein